MEKSYTPVETIAILLLTWFRFSFYVLGIQQLTLLDSIVLVSFSFYFHKCLDNQIFLILVNCRDGDGIASPRLIAGLGFLNLPR